MSTQTHTQIHMDRERGRVRERHCEREREIYIINILYENSEYGAIFFLLLNSVYMQWNVELVYGLGATKSNFSIPPCFRNVSQNWKDSQIWYSYSRLNWFMGMSATHFIVSSKIGPA